MQIWDLEIQFLIARRIKMSQQRELEFNGRVLQIKEKYEPQIRALTENGAKIASEYTTPGDGAALIGVDVKVDWKDVDIYFDLPSVIIKDKSVSLDLPEILNKRQEISFDVPDVRMVDRKIGQKPEFYGFTIRWTDIIISVPEPYMRRVEISFDLPTVNMKRHDFVIGLPEFTMNRNSWKISLPQFTVQNINAQAADIQKKGNVLKDEGERIAAAMQSEIGAEVARYTAELVGGMLSTTQVVANSFDSALGVIGIAIENLSKQGCDPVKIPAQEGDINLRKIYESLSVSKSLSLDELQFKPDILLADAV